MKEIFALWHRPPFPTFSACGAPSVRRSLPPGWAGAEQSLPRQRRSGNSRLLKRRAQFGTLKKSTACVGRRNHSGGAVVFFSVASAWSFVRSPIGEVNADAADGPVAQAGPMDRWVAARREGSASTPLSGFRRVRRTNLGSAERDNGKSSQHERRSKRFTNEVLITY